MSNLCRKCGKKMPSQEVKEAKEQERYNYQMKIESLNQKLADGRDYLMTVSSDEITVEDTLEKFGFGRNGLKP